MERASSFQFLKTQVPFRSDFISVVEALENYKYFEEKGESISEDIIIEFQKIIREFEEKEFSVERDVLLNLHHSIDRFYDFVSKKNLSSIWIEKCFNEAINGLLLSLQQFINTKGVMKASIDFSCFFDLRPQDLSTSSREDSEEDIVDFELSPDFVFPEVSEWKKGSMTVAISSRKTPEFRSLGEIHSLLTEHFGDLDLDSMYTGEKIFIPDSPVLSHTIVMGPHQIPLFVDEAIKYLESSVPSEKINFEAISRETLTSARNMLNKQYNTLSVDETLKFDQISPPVVIELIFDFLKNIQPIFSNKMLSYFEAWSSVEDPSLKSSILQNICLFCLPVNKRRLMKRVLDYFVRNIKDTEVFNILAGKLATCFCLFRSDNYLMTESRKKGMEPIWRQNEELSKAVIKHMLLYFKDVFRKTETSILHRSTPKYNVITRASVDKLIEKMTDFAFVDLNEPDFIEMILLTHPYFISSDEFCVKLAKRYQISPNKYQRKVNKLIVRIFYLWLKKYPECVDDGRRGLKRLILASTEPISDEVASLRKELEKELTSNFSQPSSRIQSPTSRNKQLPLNESADLESEASSFNYNTEFKLENSDLREVAGQLTLIDHELLKRIKPEELLTEFYKKERQKDAERILTDLRISPNFCAMIAAWQNRVRWVASEILGVKESQRANIISVFINLADILQELQNFHGCFAIMYALEWHIVDQKRLKSAWDIIKKKGPIKTYKKLEELLKIIEYPKTYHNFLKRLLYSNEASIPFWKFWQKDLQGIDRMETIVDGQVNLEKMRGIWFYAYQLNKFKASNYSISKNPSLYAWLKNPKIKSEGELFRISEEISSNKKARSDAFVVEIEPKQLFQNQTCFILKELTDSFIVTNRGNKAIEIELKVDSHTPAHIWFDSLPSSCLQKDQSQEITVHMILIPEIADISTNFQTFVSIHIKNPENKGYAYTKYVHISVSPKRIEGLNEISEEDLEKHARNIDQEHLAKGAQAVVYKVDYKGKTMVKKVMLDKKDREEFDGRLFMSKIQEFRQEIEIISKCDHPNIVKIFGACISHFTILMDYYPLGSLGDVLKTQELNREQILKFALDIASGMNYLHKCQIAHRDLKTANILVYSLNEHEEVNLRITDFSLSKIYEKDTSSIDKVGTIFFMAPEIFENKHTKRFQYFKQDVYSFGITLWEIAKLKGQEIYSELDLRARPIPQHFYHFLLNGGTPKITEEMQSKAPKGYFDLMQECWSLDPSDRPDFQDILVVLQRMSPSFIGRKTENTVKQMEKKEPRDNINKNKDDEQECTAVKLSLNGKLSSQIFRISPQTSFEMVLEEVKKMKRLPKEDNFIMKDENGGIFCGSEKVQGNMKHMETIYIQNYEDSMQQYPTPNNV